MQSTPRRPMQIHLEPAPIAQPIEEAATETTASHAHGTETDPAQYNEADEPSLASGEDGDDLLSSSENQEGQNITWPNAPHNDPDSLSPNDKAELPSAASTPIDPNFLKSFPDVPDESKPRVEVHVTSPTTTPHKLESRESFSFSKPDDTPTKLPRSAKSLSIAPDMGSPPAQADDQDLLEISESAQDVAPGLSKRLSAKRSPKSPLLGDEDPGDFEPGEEGWAVVHPRT